MNKRKNKINDYDVEITLNIIAENKKEIKQEITPILNILDNQYPHNHIIKIKKQGEYL